MSSNSTPHDDYPSPALSGQLNDLKNNQTAVLSGSNSREPCQARSSPDGNLLLGLLALQNNFIDRNALVAAFTSWIADRSRELGSILVELGALSSRRLALLESLAEEHILQHDNDPERSLAALRPVDSVRDELSRLADSEIQQSLAHLTCARRDDDQVRSEGNGSTTVGQYPTSAGARFCILRSHAHGGLGEVFIARDLELNREVALKEIRPHLADEPRYRSRFQFEAEVTGGLEHPGVVPVYGLGKMPDGRPYYAMRFIKGHSLKEAIRDFHEADEQQKRAAGQRTLEIRELLGRFMDVCDVVAYAHSRGVLHRDLKPANIMLGKYGETLVVDWGLAKVLGSAEPESPAERSEPLLKPASSGDLEPTMAGSVLGTPAYVSPEQVDPRMGDVGVPSDVYCLGGTLYHLLTGHVPCESGQVGDVYQRVLAGKIPRPRTLDPKIAPALEAICLKALALKPANRYASAEALRSDVARWLADQPVMAYPEPWHTRAGRWLRRNRAWVIGAASLLLVTALGLAIHDWQLMQEKSKTADQLVMTREALTDLYKVAGLNLADVPNTEPLRQELANLVLAKYKNLDKKFPNDRGIKLETAQVHRVSAGIQRLTGQYKASEESCLQAIDLLNALCAVDSQKLEYRRWLSEAVRELGELYHVNGQTSRAEPLFERAIDQARLLLSGPISIPYRRAMATALVDLAEVHNFQRRYDKAREAAGQAIEVIKPIALGKQESKQWPRDLWLYCLALTTDSPYTLDEAEAALERALQRLVKLVAENKLTPQYREELAVTRTRRAEVKLARQRPLDAGVECQAAIELLNQLISEQARRGAPENPQYLSLLGQANSLSGRIQTAQGHIEDGRVLRLRGAEDLRRAVELDHGRARDEHILRRLEEEISQESQARKPG